MPLSFYLSDKTLLSRMIQNIYQSLGQWYFGTGNHEIHIFRNSEIQNLIIAEGWNIQTILNARCPGIPGRTDY